jgi:hypothetical protein
VLRARRVSRQVCRQDIHRCHRASQASYAPLAAPLLAVGRACVRCAMREPSPVGRRDVPSAWPVRCADRNGARPEGSAPKASSSHRPNRRSSCASTSGIRPFLRRLAGLGWVKTRPFMSRDGSFKRPIPRWCWPGQGSGDEAGLACAGSGPGSRNLMRQSRGCPTIHTHRLARNVLRMLNQVRRTAPTAQGGRACRAAR